MNVPNEPDGSPFGARRCSSSCALSNLSSHNRVEWREALKTPLTAAHPAFRPDESLPVCASPPVSALCRTACPGMQNAACFSLRRSDSCSFALFPHSVGVGPKLWLSRGTCLRLLSFIRENLSSSPAGTTPLCPSSSQGGAV